MKKLFLLCFIAGFGANAFAQGEHLERFVIASGGDYFANSSLNICFTIGELAAVETFTNPLMDLTQGFQQPEPEYKGIAEIKNAQGDLSVFPNPAKQLAGIRFKGLVDDKLTIRLINVLGQVVKESIVSPEMGKQDFVLELSGISQGLYVVDVCGKRGGIEFREQVKLTVIN